MMSGPDLSFYEFFAGGGMARAGLGPRWSCAFANDFDPHKAAAYALNWGDHHLHVGDVWDVRADQLNGRADLAWASSPCQDLSLAGRRAGLSGARSSAFWGFMRLVETLDREERAPRCIAFENVSGLLTSNGGEDLATVIAAFAERGYRAGALEMDAAAFLPQSRPRLFIIATREAPGDLSGVAEESPFHTRRVLQAYDRLPDALKAAWIWWRTPAPPTPNADLASTLEPDAAVAWHSSAQTTKILAQLSPLHRRRLDALLESGERRVGAVFRRMRVVDGIKLQRAELRLDGLAGCLRTPRGGSSRQMLLVAQDGQVRTRNLTAREGARLMGLSDAYRLPTPATAALHLVGDGVAAPVVRHLAKWVLEPLLAHRTALAAE